MQWYERKLPMSVGDMVHEYRQAKDPGKQIDIIADQCDTKSTRIAWLLNRAGCPVDKKKLPRARRTEGSVDFIALWENSEEARQADQIRERMLNELMGDTLNKIMELQPATEPMKEGSDEKDRITAIMWDAYINARRTKSISAKDVQLMRRLEEIAAEMVEEST